MDWIMPMRIEGSERIAREEEECERSELVENDDPLNGTWGMQASEKSLSEVGLRTQPPPLKHLIAIAFCHLSGACASIATPWRIAKGFVPSLNMSWVVECRRD